MGFFRYLTAYFRKGKPSASHRSRFQAMLESERLHSVVSRQMDLVFSQPLGNFRDWNWGHVGTNGENGKEIPEIPWHQPSFERVVGFLQERKIRDFFQEDTQSALVDALLEPGTKPKLEVYERILGQKEIGDWISVQLTELVMAINQKLNPFSQILKSSRFDEQIAKTIQGFVPSIQNSLAKKLADDSRDPALEEIFRNTLAILSELGREDFVTLDEERRRSANAKWKEVGERIFADPKLRSLFWEACKIGFPNSNDQSGHRVVPESNTHPSFKDILFDDERSYEIFLTQLSMLVAHGLRECEKQTGLISGSYELWAGSVE